MKLGVLKIIIIVVTGVCPVYIGCFYLWPNGYPWVGMVHQTPQQTWKFVGLGFVVPNDGFGGNGLFGF